MGIVLIVIGFKSFKYAAYQVAPIFKDCSILKGCDDQLRKDADIRYKRFEYLKFNDYFTDVKYPNKCFRIDEKDKIIENACKF